jgi:iron-sulfur cluster repair protein YtfE (RIC family)
MVAVHRVFRREFRQAADLVLQAPAGNLRRATVIAGHLDLVTGALRHHHKAEDEYLWPILLERVRMRADLVHRMEFQHEVIARHLCTIESLLGKWRRTAAASVAGELSSALRSMSKALGEHLDDEEHDILPLVRDCLSATEWGALGAWIPMGERCTGLVLAEASRAETRILLNRVPRQARLRWKVGGRHGYARYIKRVHGDALL